MQNRAGLAATALGRIERAIVAGALSVAVLAVAVLMVSGGLKGADLETTSVFADASSMNLF